jgi:hypothetical protein
MPTHPQDAPSPRPGLYVTVSPADELAAALTRIEEDLSARR